MGISIVICCYNSVARIKATLWHIKKQLVSDDVQWEVVVVDNNSTDNTSNFVRQLFVEFDMSNYKIVKEMEPGLSHARACGIGHSAFELILFCDDDNWLENNYLQKSLEFFQNNARAAILGGRVEPVFEKAPPSWFLDNLQHYAVGDQFSEEGDISYSRGFVWGAGMVARKSALQEVMNAGKKFDLYNSDRKGISMSAGGDKEICLLIRSKGWKIFYSRSLSLKHFIPKERMNWSRLRKMFWGFGEASLADDFYLKENRSFEKELKLLIHYIYSRKKYFITYFREHTGDKAVLILEFHLGRLKSLLLSARSYSSKNLIATKVT